MSASGGGQGNWGPWPVTPGSTGGGGPVVIPGQVKVTAADEIAGFLDSKTESSDGSILLEIVDGTSQRMDFKVAPLTGGAGQVVTDNTGKQKVVAGPTQATLLYNFNLAGFTGKDLTNVGLLAGATETYDTGSGPMIQSSNGASSSDCEYGLSLAGTRVIITGKTVRNDLSGGTGTTSFHVTRNGVIVATLDLIEGAGSQDPTTLTVQEIIAEGATTDTYGLSCTNGTGPTGGALTGSISIIVCSA